MDKERCICVLEVTGRVTSDSGQNNGDCFVFLVCGNVVCVCLGVQSMVCTYLWSNIHGMLVNGWVWFPKSTFRDRL